MKLLSFIIYYFKNFIHYCIPIKTNRFLSRFEFAAFVYAHLNNCVYATKNDLIRFILCNCLLFVNEEIIISQPFDKNFLTSIFFSPHVYGFYSEWHKFFLKYIIIIQSTEFEWKTEKYKQPLQIEVRINLLYA